MNYPILVERYDHARRGTTIVCQECGAESDDPNE